MVAKKQVRRSAKQKAERGEFRAIYVALIESPEWHDLSHEAATVLWILKMKLGRAGIGVVEVESLPRYCKMPWERVVEGVRELVRDEWLRTEGFVWWGRNFLLYDPTRPLEQPHMVASIQAYIETLPKLKIVNDFAAYYKLRPPFPKVNPSPRVGEGFGLGIGNPSRPRMTDDGIRNTDTDERGLPASSSVPAQLNKAEAASIALPLAGVDNDVETFVSACIRLVNVSMREAKLSFRPIMTQHGASRQVVFDWLEAGYSRDLITEVLTGKAKDLSKPVSSLAYFSAAVKEGADRVEQGFTAVAQRPLPGSEQDRVYGEGEDEEQEERKRRTRRKSNGKGPESTAITVEQPAPVDLDKLVSEWSAAHPEDADQLKTRVALELKQSGVHSERWIRVQGAARYKELVLERINAV